MEHEVAYHMEADPPACDHCGCGGEFFIIGPDDVRPMGGSGGKEQTTCDDPEAVQEIVDMLNEAYELGHAKAWKELPEREKDAFRKVYMDGMRRDAALPETFKVLQLPDQYGGPATLLQIHSVERLYDGNNGKLVRITVA